MVIILLLYIQPNFLVTFSNTLIGKAIFIALIILATLQNNICGLLLAVLFIILLEYNYEGMELLDTNEDEDFISKAGAGVNEEKPIDEDDKLNLDENMRPKNSSA